MTSKITWHDFPDDLGETLADLRGNIEMSLDHARNVLKGTAEHRGYRAPYLPALSGRAMHHLWTARHRVLLLNGDAAGEMHGHIARACDSLFDNPKETAKPLYEIADAKRILKAAEFEEE